MNLSLWNTDKDMWEKIKVGLVEATIGTVLLLIMFFLAATVYPALAEQGIPLKVPTIPKGLSNEGLFFLWLGTMIPVFIKEMIDTGLLNDWMEEKLGI